MRIIIIPCLFFIHFYSIFLWVDVVSGSGQSLEDQRNLLLRLREGLVFDSSLSVKLVTWDPSFDCCSWKGVSCENGRVTDLDLSDESISDGINDSSSLFELRYLKRLNLAFNRLNFTDIPSRIGELVNLTYLNLSSVEFSGQIPIGIAGLRRLANVDISSIYGRLSLLKLEDPNLRTLVKNLSGLEELHLDGVDISTGGDDWCKALSSSLQNLRVLSLSDCNLRGPIDSSLANLRLLSDVRLGGNNLTGRFPEQIFQVPTLKAIDLSGNMYLQGPLPEFPQNSSLERLVLPNTNFSGELPYSIGNLKFLSEIDLGSCGFSGFLPSSVSNLTKLVHVDMHYNSFVGPLPSFSYAKSLTRLDLSYNFFNGSIVSTIWNGLSQLSTLDLRFNSLGGIIPSSLFSIPSLQVLYLSINQFDKLTILNASSCLLEFLDLSFNNLGGPFPISIFKFQNLKLLRLLSNNFTGKIEISMIGQMKNLSILNLSYNSLWIDANGSNASPSFSATFQQLELASCRLGKFPNFLKNQSELTDLDLSMNQIPGKIPNWIWGISTTLNYLNLSNNHLAGFEKPVVNITFDDYLYLDLHSNKLQGELPLPPSARYLDFSQNNFGPVIPSNIGSFLSDCEFLSLSSNYFTGVIPESICNATQLQVLDLSNNSLSGTIPECLTNFARESLEVINLQMNNLNGSISDTFLVGCGLTTLELNGNQLTGPVPKSLANCTELELLNLGNNQLSDTFPCSLMNISSLCVLVLRSNYFYGEMGCLETKGNSTRLQIVDLASNNFSGQLHPRSFLTWKAMIANSDETGLTHRRPEVLGESHGYYQDTVKVTIKGLERKLEKILSVFTSIDFSENMFEGSIPDTIGNLTSLFSLNLSHNAFSGGIPTSMEYLSQLESLDLSCNSLTGTIPQGLAALTYLSVLNLSFNHLEGHIPTGGQFNNLCENSFLGNKGLVGPQVKRKCKDDTEAVVSLPPSSGDNNTRPNKSEVSWRLISTEVGFTFGLGIVIGSLLFWQKWREWYFERVDRVFVKIHCH